MTITIPFPPATGNHMWKHAGRKHYLTEKAKRYYYEVAYHVRAQNAVLGISDSIAVEVLVFPPDKRRRDLDNLWKVIGDSLTKAGVWEDDSLIEKIVLQRMGVDSMPRVEIRIESVAKFQ